MCEAGREFKEVSRSKMDDAFFASPAFANGRVFLRGNKNIWCFGEGGGAPIDLNLTDEVVARGPEAGSVDSDSAGGCKSATAYLPEDALVASL